jgi:uncharacterized membrane protein YsdA (DUF1294 family)/cold shock CspA family protein
MKFQGKIFDWNDEKGFGFVKPNGGGDKAFVHIKSFISSARRPMNDDEISYHIIKDKNDRYRAINIELLLGNVSTISVVKSLFIDSASIASFLILLTLLTLNNFLPFIAACIYASTSIITYFVYAEDKSAAQKNKWRTEESTLHLLSFFGGWPGAFYAQKKLRHKSRKIEFQKTYWVTVFFNIVLSVWFIAGNGFDVINSIFHFIK